MLGWQCQKPWKLGVEAGHTNTAHSLVYYCNIKEVHVQVLRAVIKYAVGCGDGSAKSNKTLVYRWQCAGRLGHAHYWPAVDLLCSMLYALQDFTGEATMSVPVYTHVCTYVYNTCAYCQCMCCSS